MKCFSSFSSFCRRSRTRSPPSEEADYTLTAVSETGSSRRRRLSACRPGSSAHWRPGLTAIYEDVAPKADARRTDRLRKKSASERESLDKSYCFSHPEEYRRPNSMSMVMPTFSPTPFMF